MRKLIFLDIDGVLNNDHTKEKFNGFTGLSKHLLEMFLNWLKDKDYKLVLSSSWRIPSAYGDFKNHLIENGLSFIGETPYLKGAVRGVEIQAWLVSNTSPMGTKYVIFDDMNPSEFLKHQRQFLVQTSPIHGLRERNLKKADSLLT